jgi:hypothetical protein
LLRVAALALLSLAFLSCSSGPELRDHLLPDQFHLYYETEHGDVDNRAVPSRGFNHEGSSLAFGLSWNLSRAPTAASGLTREDLLWLVQELREKPAAETPAADAPVETPPEPASAEEPPAEAVPPEETDVQEAAFHAETPTEPPAVEEASVTEVSEPLAEEQPMLVEAPSAEVEPTPEAPPEEPAPLESPVEVEVPIEPPSEPTPPASPVEAPPARAPEGSSDTLEIALAVAAGGLAALAVIKLGPLALQLASRLVRSDNRRAG